ncbi:hypothetical protein BDZ91DRAFT_767847 [Kalaharituber pfeilii]|nr:hypothetical protein BDZ91DRAFT_767847 [Kalaharituber pfeilii]
MPAIRSSTRRAAAAAAVAKRPFTRSLARAARANGENVEARFLKLEAPKRERRRPKRKQCSEAPVDPVAEAGDQQNDVGRPNAVQIEFAQEVRAVLEPRPAAAGRRSSHGRGSTGRREGTGKRKGKGKGKAQQSSPSPLLRGNIQLVPSPLTTPNVFPGAPARDPFRRSSAYSLSYAVHRNLQDGGAYSGESGILKDGEEMEVMGDRELECMEWLRQDGDEMAEAWPQMRKRQNETPCRRPRHRKRKVETAEEFEANKRPCPDRPSLRWARRGMPVQQVVQIQTQGQEQGGESENRNAAAVTTPPMRKVQVDEDYDEDDDDRRQARRPPIKIYEDYDDGMEEWSLESVEPPPVPPSSPVSPWCSPAGNRDYDVENDVDEEQEWSGTLQLGSRRVPVYDDYDDGYKGDESRVELGDRAPVPPSSAATLQGVVGDGDEEMSDDILEEEDIVFDLYDYSTSENDDDEGPDLVQIYEDEEVDEEARKAVDPSVADVSDGDGDTGDDVLEEEDEVSFNSRDAAGTRYRLLQSRLTRQDEHEDVMAGDLARRSKESRNTDHPGKGRPAELRVSENLHNSGKGHSVVEVVSDSSGCSVLRLHGWTPGGGRDFIFAPELGGGGYSWAFGPKDWELGGLILEQRWGGTPGGWMLSIGWGVIGSESSRWEGKGCKVMFLARRAVLGQPQPCVLLQETFHKRGTKAIENIWKSELRKATPRYQGNRIWVVLMLAEKNNEIFSFVGRGLDGGEGRSWIHGFGCAGFFKNIIGKCGKLKDRKNQGDRNVFFFAGARLLGFATLRSQRHEMINRGVNWMEVVKQETAAIKVSFALEPSVRGRLLGRGLLPPVVGGVKRLPGRRSIVTVLYFQVYEVGECEGMMYWGNSLKEYCGQLGQERWSWYYNPQAAGFGKGCLKICNLEVAFVMDETSMGRYNGREQRKAWDMTLGSSKGVRGSKQRKHLTTCGARDGQRTVPTSRTVHELTAWDLDKILGRNRKTGKRDSGKGGWSWYYVSEIRNVGVEEGWIKVEYY